MCGRKDHDAQSADVVRPAQSVMHSHIYKWYIQTHTPSFCLSRLSSPMRGDAILF